MLLPIDVCFYTKYGAARITCSHIYIYIYIQIYIYIYIVYIYIHIYTSLSLFICVWISKNIPFMIYVGIYKYIYMYHASIFILLILFQFLYPPSDVCSAIEETQQTASNAQQITWPIHSYATHVQTKQQFDQPRRSYDKFVGDLFVMFGLCFTMV